MKIVDMTAPLLGYKGEQVIDPKGDPVEIRDVIYQALNGNEPSLSEEDKRRCFRLTVAAFASDKLELDTKDAAFLLQRSGLMLSQLGHGRLSEIIEDASGPPGAASSVED